MRLIRSVATHILKNCDAYAIGIVAFVVAIFDVLGQASSTVVSATVLAILSVLGFTLLRDRLEKDRLRSAIDRIRDPDALAARFFAKEDRLDEIRDLVRSSREVWLMGATLQAHIPPLTEVFAYSMREDLPERDRLRVKILLLKPRSSSISMAVFRAHGGETEEQLNQDLEGNLSRLMRLAATQPAGQLEIRTVDYLAPYTLYAYDPDLPSGQMEMRLTTFRGSHFMRPTFRLVRARDGEWYNHFYKEFEKIWNTAAAN